MSRVNEILEKGNIEPGTKAEELLISLIKEIEASGGGGQEQYILPTSSSTIKGGSKVGKGLTVIGETLHIDDTIVKTDDLAYTKVTIDSYLDSNIVIDSDYPVNFYAYNKYDCYITVYVSITALGTIKLLEGLPKPVGNIYMDLHGDFVNEDVAAWYIDTSGTLYQYTATTRTGDYRATISYPIAQT